MHDTIITAIVVLTVRVVFVFAIEYSFVFMCAVAFGFALERAAASLQPVRGPVERKKTEAVESLESGPSS